MAVAFCSTLALINRRLIAGNGGVIMAKICFVGLPGKIGRCVTVPPGSGPGKPVPPPKGRLADEGYSNLFVDTSIVDSIHEATKGISDDGARGALENGVRVAVDAIQRRAGGDKEVIITLSD
jgi:hypothetical protein